MKNKFIITFFSLMLCMGVFAFPAFAADTPDITPPTLTANLSSEILHIEASDSGSGVEAVFIDGHRINYRVDGALNVAFKDYAGTGEFVAVQAVDFAGNKSTTVQVKNPYYVAPTPSMPVAPTPKPTVKPTPTPIAEPTETPTVSEIPTQEPTTAVEEKPFTPNGTGTVVDNATSGDGKEFFTILTPDKNEFYLIIDRQRTDGNVYLLNAVTEDDLAALAKKSENKGTSAIPTPVTPQPTTTPTPEPTPETPVKQSGNGGTMIFMLLAVLAAGGAGYYFKIYKPKQQSADSEDFEDEDDEEMEFDDDVEVSDDADYPDDTADTDDSDDVIYIDEE